MTNDETQRNMDFIVAQQVQFSADIQHLKELHAQGDKRLAKTDDIVKRIASATLTLTQRMMELAEAQTHMNSNVGRFAESQTRLAESQTELAESQTKLAESQARLAESQEHTDQRLNAIIDIVRDSMNGKG